MKRPQGMLYAQDIQITDPDVNTFGRNILAKNNLICWITQQNSPQRRSGYRF